MKVIFYSTKNYDKEFFEKENKSYNYKITFIDCRLDEESVELAKGHKIVCVFTNDKLNEKVLNRLKNLGVGLITLRCAGYNNIDMLVAHRLGLVVTRVPAYSPDAIAEHSLALILALNRKIHKAYNRTREANFSIDGLMGFNIKGKTVGVIGFGRIGKSFASKVKAFGSKVVVYDPYVKNACSEYQFVQLDELLKSSDIVSMHCPLNPETYHMINDQTIALMKPGVMLINTSRGATIHTQAVIKALKNKHIGYLGLDVYEEEEPVFFEDLSNQVICDDILMRLMTFPNVIVTAHQAFFTIEAMHEITKTTFLQIYRINLKNI